MKNYVIRKAVNDDIIDIIAVLQSACKVSYKGYIPDEHLNNLCCSDEILHKWNDYMQKYECYVAQTKNAGIVGFIMNGIEHDKISEIGMLYVRPEYQRQGIGTMLVDYFCNIRKKSNYKQCVVWTIKNGPSINFYNKMGFAETKEEKNWKYNLLILKMIKEL